MAFFFCKNPQLWPKGPIQIVVWVAEGIRGYEVVSKHSKCSHTCGFFFFSGPLPEKRKLLVGISQTLIRSGKDGEQMANRTRNIVLRVPVTAEERAMIEHKMQQMGTGCFSVYARKMLIDGYVIRLDYSDVKAMTAELQKIGTNINQIAKRVNATGTLYAQDIEDIKGAMAEIWQLQRSILSKAP